MSKCCESLNEVLKGLSHFFRDRPILLIILFFSSFQVHAGLKPIKEIFTPDPSLYPESEYAKVAVVQWAPDQPTPLGVSRTDAELFKLEQRKILEHYIREAAANGAKLVVTPEFGIVGYPDIPELPPAEDEYRNPDDIRPYVETVPGPTTDYFSLLAKELGIYIHVGFAELEQSGEQSVDQSGEQSVDQSGEPTTEKFYNVIVALDPQGNIAAKFRKINLFKTENNFLYRGNEAVAYWSPWGWVGIAICADIYSRFPMSAYNKMGIDVLAVSSSWTSHNTAYNYFVLAARNGQFAVLGSNQSYFPDSGVVSPDGSVQSHIRQSVGVAYGFVKYVGKGPESPASKN